MHDFESLSATRVAAEDLPRPVGAGECLYYLHIPKTAGTSLRTFLEDHFAAAESCPAWMFDEVMNRSPSWWGQFRLICGHFGRFALDLIPGRPRVVTMVRRPREWAVSVFRHAVGTPGHALHQRCREMSFEQFVMDPRGQVELANLQTRSLALRDVDRDFFEAGHWHLEDPGRMVRRYQDPRLLEEALGVLDGVEVVGLAERFDASLALIAHRFGWPAPETFPRYNVSKVGQNRLELSPEAEKVLGELTALDEELYRRARARFEADMTLFSPERAAAVYGRGMSERPRSSRVRVGFEGQLLGSGWLPRERLADGSVCRWTGPGTVATMDLALASDADLRITFRCGAYLAEQAETLRLTVNGHAIELTSRRSSWSAVHERVYTGRIAASVLRANPAFARLAFSTCRTIQPSTTIPGDPDDRTLGLYFSWIEIEPA